MRDSVVDHRIHTAKIKAQDQGPFATFNGNSPNVQRIHHAIGKAGLELTTQIAADGQGDLFF